MISEQVFRYMIEFKTGMSVEQMSRDVWQARCGNIYAKGTTPGMALTSLNTAVAARLGGDDTAGRS